MPNSTDPPETPGDVAADADKAAADPLATLCGVLRRELATPGRLDGVEALWLGFSGGADSTALLVGLTQLRARGELRLPCTAVHLHHGLRGAAADADAAWCAATAARLGVPYRDARLDVPRHVQPGESVESAARRLRLAWWREHAPAASRTAVVLAHQADDVLETLILRLIRGANASGLTGLRPRRLVDGVLLLRPLLAIQRVTIEAALRAADLADWRHDATNDSRDYARNRVRHDVLPLLRSLAGHDHGLHLTHAHLLDDALALEAAADLAAQAIVPAAGGVGATLPIDGFAAASSALRGRLLRRLLDAAGAPNLPPRRAAIDALAAHFASPGDAARDCRPWRLELGGGWQLRLTRHLACVERSPEPATTSAPANALATQPWAWSWRGQTAFTLPGDFGMVDAAFVAQSQFSWPDHDDPWRAVFPASSLPPTLYWRARRPGDHLVPFGETRPRRLKKLVAAAHLDAARHPLLVLLVDAADTVLWVPGVRRAAHLPVSFADDRLVRLHFRPRELPSCQGVGMDPCSPPPSSSLPPLLP